MSNPVLSPFPAKPVAMPAGTPFRIASDFTPAGDQPQAIRELTQGLLEGERDQVLLGVTGSGKTFTAAQAIAELQRPALVLAPNKTLAAQRSEEHTSELQSLMRISYAVFCLKKKKQQKHNYKQK